MHKPVSFRPEPWLEVAKILLNSDETLMALKVLDMVPAYLRDHKSPELEELKREIMARIATASFYATDKGFELSVDDETCLKHAKTLRAMLVAQDVKALNENGLKPHVIDMGPGEGSLPFYLISLGLDFTYQQVYVNQPTYEQTRHRFKSVEAVPAKEQPIIFVATEVIEHLHCESEIRFEMEKACGLADIVHISTPLYAFNPFVEDWKKIGTLGHLRTYTPTEFQKTVTEMFKEYAFAYYESQVQHIRLFNPKSRFDSLKVHYNVKTE